MGQLPTTNIYTLDLRANEQKVLLNNLTFLTDFNHTGYNNQPYFSNSNELYIVSDYQSAGLTDILHLDLGEKKITRITATEEGEYSPVYIQSNNEISVVRQGIPEDGKTAQVLWLYPADRSEFGECPVPEIENLGYYLWLTKDKIAMFLVDQPSELILYDLRLDTRTHIDSDVGRCLQKDRNGNLYYIKMGEQQNTIVNYDIYLGRSREVIQSLPNQLDFAILPNNFLIAAEDSVVKVYNPLDEVGWKEVTDLKGGGIELISRIAVSNNKIAIVSVDP